MTTPISRRALLGSATVIAAGAAVSVPRGASAEAASTAGFADAVRRAGVSDPSGAPPAGVTDHVVLGEPGSEGAHQIQDTGSTDVHSGTVEAGQLTEAYTARSVAAGGRFTVRVRVAPNQPLTLQVREVRPDDKWGAEYGFRVLLGGTLVYVRDPRTADPGGGPYSSVHIDTADPDLTRDGFVEVTVEGTSAELTYINEIWAYGDLAGMVRGQQMRVPDRMVFVLGQDYKGETYFRQRLDYLRDHVTSSPQVGLGMAVLDYYAVRTPAQVNANYALLMRLSADYGWPFAIHSTTDWEGTPTHVPDGKGGHFGDIRYQQILWSPQDQTGPDQDVWNGQRLDQLLGDRYEPHYGLSVPNIWGSTPWLTWRDPDLNAYYTKKLNDAIGQLRPMVWDMQRGGARASILPFSTTMECTYWSKRDGVGVADQGYTSYNGGVERRDLYADFNPSTVAAAKADGVTLDPTDGLSDAEMHWLYKNQSYPQQMFADIFFHNLPRERIKAGPDGLSFPSDMLRHNVHSEIYSRKQEPYWSGVYPSLAQGILRHARPGSEYIELDDYSPGGFYHLQKSREFGRIANPNLENSVSFHAPDKTFLLRQTYVNGSRYTQIYNWQTDTANPPTDRVENWVGPFIADLRPWDVVYDKAPDGRINGRSAIGFSYQAGDLRLIDRIAVRVERTGPPAALRLTLYDSPAKQDVVCVRRLSAAELPQNGWASFVVPVTQVTRGQTYYVEIEQLEGSPAYAFPTTGGTPCHRVGLDMDYQRDRSLVIQWRRDAADAIANVAELTTEHDVHAAAVLHEATAALRKAAYVQAYRLAISADALRFPVLYQVTGTAALAPFPLTVKTGATLNLDVTTYVEGHELSFDVSTYAPGNATFTIENVNGVARVEVDGHATPATSNGENIVFTVELPDSATHVITVTQ